MIGVLHKVGLNVESYLIYNETKLDLLRQIPFVELVVETKGNHKQLFAKCSHWVNKEVKIGPSYGIDYWEDSQILLDNFDKIMKVTGHSVQLKVV